MDTDNRDTVGQLIAELRSAAELNTTLVVAEPGALADELEASQLSGVVGELREWALNQSTLHHRFAHENEHLRTEHIASSSAYRELAIEIEKRFPALNNTGGQSDG